MPRKARQLPYDQWDEADKRYLREVFFPGVLRLRRKIDAIKATQRSEE